MAIRSRTAESSSRSAASTIVSARRSGTTAPIIMAVRIAVMKSWARSGGRGVDCGPMRLKTGEYLDDDFTPGFERFAYGLFALQRIRQPCLQRRQCCFAALTRAAVSISAAMRRARSLRIDSSSPRCGGAVPDARNRVLNTLQHPCCRASISSFFRGQRAAQFP